jgi:hypothetical protein
MDRFTLRLGVSLLVAGALAVVVTLLAINGSDADEPQPASTAPESAIQADSSVDTDSTAQPAQAGDRDAARSGDQRGSGSDGQAQGQGQGQGDATQPTPSPSSQPSSQSSSSGKEGSHQSSGNNGAGATATDGGPLDATGGTEPSSGGSRTPSPVASTTKPPKPPPSSEADSGGPSPLGN